MLSPKATRVKVKKVVKVEDRYTVAHLSSSRANARYDEDGDDTRKYLYSDWGFSRLVGAAHTRGVNEGDVIELGDNWTITFESYKDKDGEWVRPKNPQLTVFDFTVYSSGGTPKETLDDILGM